jgi:hypothetical protein
MIPLQKLIELYGRQPADAVGDDLEYVQLCEANDSDMLFHHARNTVEHIKKGLEVRVAVQQTGQKQVKQALKFYQRFVGLDPQEQEICFRLVNVAYHPHWTSKQQNYFDGIVEALKMGQDYFLSFTQRNKEGVGNPVNSLHRHLIQSYGIADPVSRVDNSFAEMLNNALSASRYQFRGFFFPQHEDDSKQVVEKVAVELKRSLVFIQVIQNAMFSKSYIDKRNFCFEEYSEAVRQKKPTVYLFVDGKHPDDFILEEDTVFDLDPWHKVIHGADCVDFESTLTAAMPESIVKNRDKLRKSVVEKVQSFREVLWENAPGDLE